MHLLKATMKKEYDVSKIKEMLLSEHEAEHTLAVCMIKQYMKLGEAVDLLNVTRPSYSDSDLSRICVILSIYPLPYRMKDCTPLWNEVVMWAAKSPKRQAARSVVGKRLCERAVRRFIRLPIHRSETKERLLRIVSLPLEPTHD